MICELCETRKTDNLYIDRNDRQEKFVCDFCRNGKEIDFLDAFLPAAADDFFGLLTRTEEAVCAIPEDAWDAISIELDESERKVMGDFLRARGHEQKAKAVEGVHRGLLR